MSFVAHRKTTDYNPVLNGGCIGVPSDDYIDTNEAAELLKVTPDWIRKLIRRGLLPARKFGRDYAIKRSDLKKVENLPSAGRPPKNPQG